MEGAIAHHSRLTVSEGDTVPVSNISASQRTPRPREADGMEYYVSGKCTRCGATVRLTLGYSWPNGASEMEDGNHDNLCLDKKYRIEKPARARGKR